MEDEGFVDDEFIEETARHFVAMHGLNAIAMLAERAAIAEAAGDYLAWQTWRAIGEAAERVLGLARE